MLFLFFYIENINIKYNILSTECKDAAILEENKRIYSYIFVDLLNCIFHRINTFNQGSGGIVFIQQFGGEFGVNECTFLNCSCSGDGGAIYFNCESGNPQTNIKKVCSNGCFCGNSNNWGGFAYLSSRDSKNCLTFISYLSINKNPTNGKDFSHLFTNLGNQSLLSSNFSYNKCYMFSVLYSQKQRNFLSIYNTFFNNSAINSVCIKIQDGSGSLLFSYSNIVGNDSPLGDAVVFVSGDYIINYCIFTQNRNQLFYSKAGNVFSLEDCIIDHISNSLLTGYVFTTKNNSFFSSFSQIYTNIIENFDTFYCAAENPKDFPTELPNQSIKVTPVKTISSTLQYTLDFTSRNFFIYTKNNPNFF